MKPMLSDISDIFCNLWPPPLVVYVEYYDEHGNALGARDEVPTEENTYDPVGNCINFPPSTQDRGTVYGFRIYDQDGGLVLDCAFGFSVVRFNKGDRISADFERRY
jgi:hypothetical protein